VIKKDYYQIKDEIIWETIANELLPLKEKVLALLAKF
jgi:hypothetical protein